MVNLIIGFVLGLIGSLLIFLVTNYVNRRERLLDFKKGLLAEMRGFLGMFAMQAYEVRINLNELDFATFKWIHSLILKADQNYLSSEGREAFEMLLKLPEDELNNMWRFQSARDAVRNVSPSVKKRSFPFLETNMALVSLLDGETQLLISKILSNNEAVNQAVEDNKYCRQLTFDLNQTNDNRHRIEENIQSSYRVVAGRYLMDRISELIDNLTLDLQKSNHADKVRLLSKRIINLVRSR